MAGRFSTIADEKNWKEWSEDGLHFSEEGYDALGEIIYETIKQFDITQDYYKYDC